jgi:hypothetical protein
MLLSQSLYFVTCIAAMTPRQGAYLVRFIKVFTRPNACLRSMR